MIRVRKTIKRVLRACYLDAAPAWVRRVIVGIIGATILLIGFIMIFLPGPAILVIPIGLAILATEFIWARRWLHRTRFLVKKVRKRFGKKPAATTPPVPPVVVTPRAGLNEGVK